MEIKILGSYGGSSLNCRTTCFLINDFLALDAGSLTLALDLEEQQKVSHILLSHTHIDHIYSLPFIIANISNDVSSPISLYASKESIENLQNHLFNNYTWPDFSIIPSHTNPAIRFIEIEAERSFKIKNLNITPIKVNHIIPTFGFMVSSPDTSVLYIADTSTTEKIWDYANNTKNLKAIFIEASYPNRLRKLAYKSGHLTPADLAQELKKFKQEAEILIYHCKPEFFDEIKKDLRMINNPHISFAQQDKIYRF
jgi:ribonuclease BN (tRNA processing enzyme)